MSAFVLLKQYFPVFLFRYRFATRIEGARQQGYKGPLCVSPTGICQNSTIVTILWNYVQPFYT